MLYPLNVYSDGYKLYLNTTEKSLLILKST